MRCIRRPGAGDEAGSAARTAAMLASLLILWPPAATAEQFVLFDRTLTHDGKKRLYADWDFITGLKPEKAVPVNWLAPVNFADGTYHIRVEVLEMKPTAKRVAYFFGWVNAPKRKDPSTRHNHTRHNIKFNRPGVYEHIGKINRGTNCKDMWYGTAGGAYRDADWDWTSAWDRLYGAIVPFKQDPFPVKFRITMTIVSQGATFNPHGQYGELNYKDLAELKKVAAFLEHGHLGAAMRAAKSERESREAARAEEAGKVVAALKAHGEARRRELLALKARSPDYAVKELAALARQYAPSTLGRELMAEARRWDREPATAKARQAKRILELVRRTAMKLQRKLKRNVKATDPRFRQRHRQELAFIQAAVRKLESDYPDTASFKQSLALAESLGVDRAK